MATVLDILVNVKGDASKNLKGIQASIGQTTKSFALLKTAIAAATTGLAVQFVRNTLAAADAIGKVADKTGFAIDSLQELRFAAEQAGIANVQLDTSLQRFSRRVGEAAQGTGVLYEILQQSGIAIRNADGSMRSIEATFNDYLGVMASATSEQEKLRLAVAAFDMEGANMVNMLKDGTAGLESMRARARGLGIILDEETVRSAERANDAWGQVGNQFRAIATIAVGQLAPALENVATRLSNYLADPEKVRELEEAFAKLGDVIIGIADAINFIMESGIAWLGSIGAIAVALAKLEKIAYFVGVRIAGAAGAAAQLGGAAKLANGKIVEITASTLLFHRALSGLATVIRLSLGAVLIEALISSDSLVDRLALGLQELAYKYVPTLAAAIDDLNNRLGLSNPMTDKAMIEFEKKEAEAARKSMLEHRERNRALIDAQRKQEEFRLQLEKSTKELIKEIGAYKQSLTAKQTALQLDIELIGAGEDYANQKRLIAEAEKTHADKLYELTARLNEAKDAMSRLQEGTTEYKNQQKQIIDLEFAIENLNQAYSKHVGVLSKLSTAQAKANAAFQLQQFQTKARIDLENQLLDIQDEMAKATLPAIEQRYYDIAAAARDSAKAAIEAEEARRGGPLNKAEVEQYYAAARRGQDQLIRATKQHYDMTRSWSYGWKQAFQEYYENATNAAQKARDIFSQTMQGIEDILVNFVKTGKFEWKQFASEILESMLRMNIQSTLGNLGQMIGLGDLFGSATQQRGNSPTQPLYVLDVSTGRVAQTSSAIGNVFNNAGSGSNFLTSAWNTVKNIGSSIGNVVSSVASGIGNLFSGFFATGGTIPPGRYGIVGERGPEYVSGPATVTPMGNTQVTYTINAVDAASFKALVARDPSFIHAVAMQGARSIPMGR